MRIDIANQTLEALCCIIGEEGVDYILIETWLDYLKGSWWETVYRDKN